MHHYELNGPKVIQETFGDEVVAINFDTGHYFSMRGVAADIWRMLIAGASMDEIAGQIQQRHPAAAPGDTTAFFDALIAHALVRPCAPKGYAASGYVHLSTTYAPPMLEEFSDMSELLLLDPIHEVDAQGWPKQATP